MIIVNTPQNPVGKVFSRKELEEIAALATEFNLLVMSDEVVRFTEAKMSDTGLTTPFDISTIVLSLTGRSTSDLRICLVCGTERYLYIRQAVCNFYFLFRNDSLIPSFPPQRPLPQLVGGWVG